MEHIEIILNTGIGLAALLLGVIIGHLKGRNHAQKAQSDNDLLQQRLEQVQQQAEASLSAVQAQLTEYKQQAQLLQTQTNNFSYRFSVNF